MKNNVYILKKPYYFKVEQTELSSPKTGFVTLEYLYCGICGGDYSCYIGRRNDYPVTLGHEFVAKIIYANNSHLSEGDIVVSDLNYRCGNCRFCIEGKSHLCIQNNAKLFSNRGFAQYANMHTNYLHPIPKIEWLPRACFIEPLSCVIHACKSISIHTNSRILIVGAGSIGTMFAFYIKFHYHCKNVEIIEKIEQRAEMLNVFFDTHIYNGKNEDYDIVIDCSNTSDGTITALNSAGRGGKVCIMSHLYGLNTSFIYEKICKEEIKAYFPLRNGDNQNMKSAIDYITTFWKSDYDHLIHVYDNIEEAFSTKNKSLWNKQVVKINH